MVKSLSVLFLSFMATFSLSAQTIRTDVLVIGSTSGGVSASIQAARSGVKTLLITEASALTPVLTVEDINYLERLQNHYSFKGKKKSTLKDSLLSRNITLEESSKLIKSITDTVKNLTVMLKTVQKKIEKSGKCWEVKLQNGKTIKADVIVDATENLSAAAQVNVQPAKTVNMVNADLITDPYSNNKLFRTSVGIGYYLTNNESRAYTIPLGSLLPVEVENFILLPISNNMMKPIPMSVGQASGASAAYCSFFKTTTKNLNVRVIQGEILGFDSWMVPFADIKFTDPHAMAFQHIGVTGLLKAKIIKNGSVYEMQFDTAGTISSEELRLPMKEFYSRSQIWFANKKIEQLSIEDAISLFMFVAARGNELRPEIEKAWKTSFKFNTAFDFKRPITRREFAVLADAYLKPFNLKVDLNGKLGS